MVSEFRRLLRDRTNGHLYFAEGNRRRRIIVSEVVTQIRKRFEGIEVKDVNSSEILELEPGAVVPRETAPFSSKRLISPSGSRRTEMTTFNRLGLPAKFRRSHACTQSKTSYRPCAASVET